MLSSYSAVVKNAALVFGGCAATFVIFNIIVSKRGKSTGNGGTGTTGGTSTTTNGGKTHYPDQIILVRHGESLGNATGNEAYNIIPDWRIPLTALGQSQAKEAGRRIKELVGNRSLQIYYSPYLRTKQTLDSILTELRDNDILNIREEPRITEQQFGNFQKTADMEEQKKAQKEYGKFFYRFTNGESGMDVYERVSSYIGTLFREFEREGTSTENAEKNGYSVVIVTHGATLRLFLMRWFQASVTCFDCTKNPENAAVTVMTKVDESNASHNHPFDRASRFRYSVDKVTQEKQNWPEYMHTLSSRKLSVDANGDDTPMTAKIKDYNTKKDERIDAIKRYCEEGYKAVYEDDKHAAEWVKHMPNYKSSV